MLLDGRFLSMSYALEQRIRVGSGSHLLQVVFVALDHFPFNPSVQASVRFLVAS